VSERRITVGGQAAVHRVGVRACGGVGVRSVCFESFEDFEDFEGFESVVSS
jgi:hypothetical protein